METDNIVWRQAEVLWLALVLVLLFFITRMRLASLARRRRRAALALQVLSVLLLLGALAQPALARPSKDLSLVVVLDASDSLSEAARERVVAFARDVFAKTTPTGQARFVAAGSRVVALTPEEVRSGFWAPAGEPAFRAHR